MVWKIILQDFYKQVEWKRLKVILSLKEIIPHPQTLACMNSVPKEFKLIHPILKWPGLVVHMHILQSKGKGHCVISEGYTNWNPFH